MRRLLILVCVVLTRAVDATAQDDLDYPLGKMRFPPVTSPAEPLRLVDLNFGFADGRSSEASVEARLKLGATAFLGAEARRDRLGAFFDTQRLELGVTEQDGTYDFEGAYRARLFRVALDAKKRDDDTWLVGADGSLRVSNDWEILLAYEHDTDESRGGPPSIEDFIDTGRLPSPDPPTRVVRSGSVGVLYQQENHLELAGDASVAEIRAEAGFDQTRQRAQGRGVWNYRDLEIDGSARVDRITGRLARHEALAELGASLRIAGHFVASARTRQEWQPGVERNLRDYRARITFYGRRFRFARSSAIADEVLELTRRANALGYNERRVYDLAGLRALRERLSISPARAELAEAIDALYRAEVRERNVPQLGVELASTADEIAGSEATSYRVLVGIPWRLAWPFTRGEDRVELLRVEWTLTDTRFPSLGRKARSHALQVAAELNREHIIRFRWEDPGQSPQDLALRIRPERRIHFEYTYALGR